MRLRYGLILVALALVAGGIYFGNIDGALLRGLAATTTDTARPPAVKEGDSTVSAPANRTAERSGNPREKVGRGNRRTLSTDVVQVVVAPANVSDVPIYLSGIGTVTAYNTIDIKSQVDGVIQKMNFQEGDDVKAGDPLIIIDPEPFQARLDQWQAAKTRALAQLENAKTNLWRYQQLATHDFATQKQVDANTELVEQYTADAAEDDAKIKFAQTELGFATIRSPINGRTGIRHVDPGNLIRAADNKNIVTVVQLQPIYVIITVPATQLAEAGIAQGLNKLPVFAYAENGRTLLDRGTVQTVDNVVDPSTGTIKLKASFPNEHYKLWPGNFADCKVMVDKRHNGVTVPSAAIRHGPKGDFVWIVKPDNTADTQAVGVKQTVGETVLLDRGLRGGEKVVVEGQYYLQTGSKVEIVSKETREEPELSSNE
jgi:membrane fusion protein, multidrug efflux system